MKLRDTFRAVHCDYRRYRATGESALQTVFLSQGFNANLTYRLARYVYVQVKMPVLRQTLRFLTKLLQKFSEVLTGISLPSKAEIGAGLYIGHFGHIIVHPGAKLGENCNLSQGVTIGMLARGEQAGVPTLGDRVFVGPNAVILGNITVGNDAMIGAGVILTQSVPALSVVVGNPAGVISHQGSFEYVQYDQMDADPQRLAALSAISLDEVHSE